VRKLASADQLLANGADIAAVARELGVSEQTYYRWRNQYGGLKGDDARRLKELERENSTLKRLLAEAELDKASVEGGHPGKLLSPARRPAAVAHLQRVLGLSQRAACRAVGQHRSVQRRPPAADTPVDPDGPLREWLRGWAKLHPRWGQRRALVAAREQGWVLNHKKLQRLWREEGLRVPVRRRRRRAGTTTAETALAAAPNAVWAVDFQFDTTSDGRPFKITSIVDEHTRESLGGLVERRVDAAALVAELDRLTAARGTAPTVLRCDNGPEFVSAAPADCARTRTGLAFIEPGSPWQNGWVESFNTRLRDEHLNLHHHDTLLQARVAITDWKTAYNHDRPHSALGYRTPTAYAAQCTHRTLSSPVDLPTG